MLHSPPTPACCLPLLLSLLGCAARQTPPSDSPSPQPLHTASNHQTLFRHQQLGLEFTIPPAWKPQPSPDFVLLLVTSPENAPGNPSISLDVPDLPPHVPGWIPIALVKNGYIDDLRKKSPSLRVEQLEPPNLPRAQTRLVHSTWKADDSTCHETALLIVHGDRVYILRANADDASHQSTLAAFNAIVHSIRWLP